MDCATASREGAERALMSERQRDIYAGGDAGRRPDVPRTHEDGVGLDVHSRVAARQVIAPGPMGRGAPVIEQAGGGEQVRAGANGHRALCPAGRPRDPVDDAGVLDRITGS